MGRRAAGLITVAVLLGGCSLSGEGDELATSELDLERAQRAWQDPWLAPTQATAPTFRYGSDGQVDRSAGSREAGSARTPQRAARLEIEAAQRLGWELVGARCAAGEMTAWLARGDTLDDLAVGVVSATRDTASTQPRTLVTVTGLVPHHADGSAPETRPALAVRQTCIGGGGEDGSPLLDDLEPRAGDDAEAGPEDFEGWQSEELSDDEGALIEAVAADPWLRSVHGRLSEPDLRTGDNRRSGAVAAGQLPVRGSVAATLARTVRAMDGWDLTWAACTADYTLAALRLVTPHGVATAHVEASPRIPGQLEWTVRLPAAGTPPSDWVADAPALDSSRCLDPTTAAQGSLVIEGQPVSVPFRVQPMPG